MNSGSSTHTVHQAYLVRFKCSSLLINRTRKLLRSVASLTQPLPMQVFRKNSTSPCTITKQERARLLLLYLTSWEDKWQQKQQAVEVPLNPMNA
ncbi:unnamed protein product [Musa acuminata subsp. burmannicoides]